MSLDTVPPIRGFVPERVLMSVPLDPYLPLKALAAYSGLSVRKLRMLLVLPPDDALPCYRVGGKLLVRRGEFDHWVAQYRQRGNAKVSQLVDDVLRSLTGGTRPSLPARPTAS